MKAVFLPYLFFAATILLCLSGCNEKPHFQHEVLSEAKPWTHERFDDQSYKFTFGIFSDLTGGERKGIFNVAVAQLNLLRPELIVNVGDLIEGGSENPDEWHRQWDFFDERAAKARAPVFYAGGNHDLTGELARKVWEERLGQRYYHFIYKDVLFMVLNTEDHTPERMAEINRIRNEGIEVFKKQGPEAYAKTEYASLPERKFGKISEEQSDYFTSVIKKNQNVRWTFILIHKPAWLMENELNFKAIEDALANQPYTVFYGHTHVYKYEQRKGRDYINLATTGGKQSVGKNRSMDHLMLVTVDEDSLSIANLLMAGILDKTGHVPMDGDTLCFEKALCEEE
jgi:predicted phosphodiesterase